MRPWTPVTAALAPVALVGGWTLAATRQAPAYDAVQDSISALAAHDASDAWIMTTALVVVGVCHVGTALGLTEARLPGRLLLGLGGLATLGVAALPQPADGHVAVAIVSFAALAAWPAFGALPGRGVGMLVTVLLTALNVWLAWTLVQDDLLGLSERAVAAAEALWPLAVVAGLRLRSR